ncbi:PX domain-containing protein kinase-like protein [Naviculisporaceae sp. PSN 640]
MEEKQSISGEPELSALDQASNDTTSLNPQNAAAKPVPTETAGDEDLTTKTLHFLATATPGALGGVAVGLGAVTYLILGQLGLLLIGAFGGVLVFIQWERQNAEVARAVRGETGMDIVAKLLDGKSSEPGKKWDVDDPETALIRSFEDFKPETREALNELVEAVIRDYVKWWYAPIMPSDKFFPLSCRNVLTSFLVTISNHLSKKRPADAFLDFLTNSSSIVIVFFAELAHVFSELPAESKLSAAEAVNSYMSAHPDSNLANLLNKRQQAGKFRMVAEDLLAFLERPTYECDPARVFLREIMAGVVLETILQTCSKAEWINGWIVYLLESGEPDLSQAIDVGMQTGPNSDIIFADIDGNLGNIGLTKGNRSSLDQERARRKEMMAHRKKLSKAEEELEALEEVKRLNQMIADEDARRSRDSMRISESGTAPGLVEATANTASVGEASERLANAFKRNADELDISKDSTALKPATPSNTKLVESIARDTASDVSSNKNDAINTPLTPLSNLDSASQTSSPPPPATSSSHSQFTSFDQIVPPGQNDGEADEEEARKPPPLTLHNAIITILDEPDTGRIRVKPTWDYLVQIEPATTAYPGWMIVRKYTDFEKLHEVLRRIAAISGATAFTEQHNTLPSWKVHTRTSLRAELERYVRDACGYPSLAESEGMKRFLERDNVSNPNKGKSGFQAFEKIGKNVFDVLTSAPVEGSKAVVGGVTGVLGNIGLGQRKQAPAPAPAPAVPSRVQSPPPQQPPGGLQDVTAASRLSITLPRLDSSTSLNGSRRARDSMDSQRSSIISAQPGKISPMERRPSYDLRSEAEGDSLRPSRTSARSSREHSRASSLAPVRSPSALSMEGIKLPPPPDVIADDYESPTNSHGHQPQSFQSHSRSLTMPALSGTRATNGPKTPKQHAPLSEPETRVAVELLFAVINELYTLSSAWNIRRTLLAAAKSFLLRPGNPSLTSIQTLIQESILDANTCESGLAAHLRKIRENALPTEEERAAWPEEMSDEEKEKLRVKARKLLIESGVPAALMGVMGQSATSDALGRLFDSLQVEDVARGLMFGIMLQAVRTITH